MKTGLPLYKIGSAYRDSSPLSVSISCIQKWVEWVSGHELQAGGSNGPSFLQLVMSNNDAIICSNMTFLIVLEFEIARNITIIEQIQALFKFRIIAHLHMT